MAAMLRTAMHLICQSTSLEQTDALGRALAGVLRPGDVVALEGDLGAGKTALVRSIVAGLEGRAESVSSPTFTIAQEYQTPSATVVHIDAYRLDPDAEELGPVGFDRLAEDDSIVLIEWPSKLAGRVRFDLTLTLAHAGESARDIMLSVPESWQQRTGMLALEALCEVPKEDTICPATGERVSADCPTWPFSSERAQLIDLHGWFSEKYAVTRPIEQRDLEEE